MYVVWLHKKSQISKSREIAVVETNADGKHYLHYILKDHLGSWTTITDSDGAVEQELSYDAWGNLRDPDTWTGETAIQLMFDRGYTGHEHLSHFGLINMNGRCYDPMVSSFLSVDAFVDEPTSAQGFNRYAYCMYNPLKYVDPSGWQKVGGMRPRNEFHDDWSNSHVVPVHSTSDFTNAYYLSNLSLYGNFDGPCGGTGYTMDDLVNTYGYQVTHYANSVYNYCFRSTQKELIRNWQYNPNKTTSLDLEEAGIYYAEALYEYIGWGKMDSYCLSFKPQGKFNVSERLDASTISFSPHYLSFPNAVSVVGGQATLVQYAAYLTGGELFSTIGQTAGKVSGAISVGTTAVSTINRINYLKNGGDNTVGVATIGVTDIAFTIAGFFWPWGTIASTVYFSTEMITDDFWGWGKVKYIQQP